MKSISLFLTLFITILTVSNSIFDDFSINRFITYLKNKGLFNIIQSIKVSYGDDVAIISCEELNKNNCGNCRRVVKENMNTILGVQNEGKQKYENTKNFKYMKPNSDSKNDRDKKQKKSLKEILKEKFPPDEVNKIYNKIKAKVGNKAII